MSDMSEPQIEKKYPVKQSAAFAGSAAITMTIIDLFGHLGPTGLLVGGIASYVAWRHGPELYEQVRGLLPAPAQAGQSEQTEKLPRQRSWLDRALGRHPEGELAPAETAADDTVVVPEEDIEPANLQLEADATFTHPAEQIEVPGVARLTIEQIVSHIERNSYDIYIGRSMTRPNRPAVRINFYKRHLKLLGASQHGKTSMATALLEIILRTHDPNYVQVALLDHENKASRLFANMPHIARVRVGEQVVRLHAHSEQQVLEHLEYLVGLIDYRYNHLSEEELEQQPLIIVYLEEFIDLKDSFKHRIDLVGKDDKEQAKQDYAHLLFCIKQIARRGLKVLVQLLMCAQCDYRDEDLQEALINVTSGMAFCLRVTAAQAAGFYQTQLLQRNAKEDKIGKAVVEMPDCKDLILAPANDLRARLKALGKAVQRDTDASKNTHLVQPSSTDERLPMPSSSPSAIPAPPAENVTRLPLQSPRRRSGTGLSGKLQAALEVLQPGMNYRDLGRALCCSNDEARVIWQELKQRGLLHASKEQEPAEQESPPKSQNPVSEEDELERALRAYDEGHTTIDALAVALGKTPWAVRLLYQQVKKLRGKNIG
jgi:FtsK/SpoIIIE family